MAYIELVDRPVKSDDEINDAKEAKPAAAKKEAKPAEKK